MYPMVRINACQPKAGFNTLEHFTNRSPPTPAYVQDPSLERPPPHCPTPPPLPSPQQPAPACTAGGELECHPRSLGLRPCPHRHLHDRHTDSGFSSAGGNCETSNTQRRIFLTHSTTTQNPTPTAVQHSDTNTLPRTLNVDVWRCVAKHDTPHKVLQQVGTGVD